MKKFLVVLLACALIFGFAATASAADTQIKEFSDIADQPQAAQNAIMKLAVLGVVEGNEGIGGSFRPADNLTRAEFAKIVCYLTGNVKAAESLANVGSKFSDVSTGNWYTGWVNMAAQSGYFVGDPGGTFRPNANITMNEVVTVALRAAGYNDKLPGTWPANYALKAQNVGLLDDVTFVGSAAATRADMSLICSEVLDINMVVHISNEIAYALALSDGTVDPDGFSETYYVSNETSYRLEETILHKAFDGVYYYVLANQTELPTGDITGAEANYFDESNGWAYEDYDSDEITINILGAISYVDDDFDDYYTKSSSNSAAAEYNVTDSLASTYHIAGSYGLADLSGMQLQVLVIDKKAINYIEPYSSYVLAKSVYRNSASNIVADGKTYRASTTMGVAGKVTNEEKVAKEIADDKTGGVIDLTVYSTFGGDAIQYLHNSDSDNDYPGKIYLDKDGRVYAVKNYNAYNEIPFGIVDELDNEVVLKAQTTNWKTTGSTGSDTNYTLDTDEPYVLYKDGELIKADELAENDVITYLGDNGGHFYYVTSPVEGDFTQQTSSKMTVGGYGYRQVTGFFASDDGGEDFDAYSYAVEGPFDTASFGEVEIATAYNFSRLDYIALNTTANKVIGVVTNADPDSVYASGSTSFIPQFKKLTIYNAEGKEVTYTFTTNFRNAYNRMLSSFDKGYVPNADYSSSSTPRWGKDYFDDAKSLEGFTREIQEGDIVQLTLDKSDNIKKISNYVAFDGNAKDDGVEATVKASNNRITIKGNNITKEDGTYTLPTDAIVFNVTVDGGDYDDVDLKTVASTLSADFKAMKIVAFDTKSNGNINALYILEGVSAYKFGIISGQGRDATDDYYTVNGKRVYSDGNTAKAPSLIAYQISGGDASVTHELAWGGGGKEVYYLTDMHAIVSGLDSDYGAAVGIVNSYSSSTNALNVNGTLLYVTSDTFMYDFVADDDLTSASSLRDKFVAVIYNDDFDAISVALLSDGKDTNGVWTKLTGQGSTDDARTEAEQLTAAQTALNNALSLGVLTIPYGSDPTDVDDVIAAIKALIGNNNITVAFDAATNKVTLTIGSETPVDITLVNVVASAANTNIASITLTTGTPSASYTATKLTSSTYRVVVPNVTDLATLTTSQLTARAEDTDANVAVSYSDPDYTIIVTGADGGTPVTYTLNVVNAPAAATATATIATATETALTAGGYDIASLPISIKDTLGVAITGKTVGDLANPAITPCSDVGTLGTLTVANNTEITLASAIAGNGGTFIVDGKLDGVDVELTVTISQIRVTAAAGAASLTVTTATQGTAVGTTKLIIADVLGASNTRVYAISDTQVTGITVEDKKTGTAFVSGTTEITAAAGKYITVYELNAAGYVVSFVSRAVLANEVTPAAIAGGVIITGIARYGEILTAVPSGINADAGDRTYTWKSGTATLGTGLNYTLVAANIGQTITVEVTATTHSGKLTSAATATVARADVIAPAMTIVALNDTVTITLTGGTFKAGTITAADFEFAGTDSAALAAGSFARTSDTVVTITFTAGGSGSDNVITVKADTMATQATSVATVATTD